VKRLDRAVSNPEWRMKFLLAHLINGDPYHSDHRRVIIDTKEVGDGERTGGCD
jgi:hypothetical protein